MHFSRADLGETLEKNVVGCAVGQTGSVSSKGKVFLMSHVHNFLRKVLKICVPERFKRRLGPLMQGQGYVPCGDSPPSLKLSPMRTV